MSTHPDLPLREEDLLEDPLAQFTRWYREARETSGYEAEAVALASATADGRPSLRMVLAKAMDERGIAFFTNYASRKAGELDANPRAALLFHWGPLGRQVRIEGTVSRVSREETEAYATRRARESQLSALASPQSRVVPGREWLERRVAELGSEHPDAVPVSEEWGGYRLAPEAWEFWQHRANRLHDRFAYTPEGQGWRIERLAP